MSTDGFVLVQLTPTQRHVGSSGVFDTVDEAEERAARLRKVAPYPELARFRIARIEYLEDAS